MRNNEPLTEAEKQACNEIGDAVWGIIEDADSEIALHALTTVIAEIVGNMEPQDQTQSMIDVFHMLAHKFDVIVSYPKE